MDTHKGVLSKSRNRRRKIRKEKEKRVMRVRKEVMQKALNFVNCVNQGLQHSEGPRHHSSDNSSQ